MGDRLLGARSAARLLCGPYHPPLAVFSGTGPTEDEKARAAEVLRQAAELAAERRAHARDRVPQPLRVLLPQHHGRRQGLVQRVNHPNFGAMYDTFHANIEEKDPIGVHRARPPT